MNNKLIDLSYSWSNATTITIQKDAIIKNDSRCFVEYHLYYPHSDADLLRILQNHLQFQIPNNILKQYNKFTNKNEEFYSIKPDLNTKFL